MIYKLMATTAVATLLATGALAQTQPAPADPNAPTNAPATEQSAPAVAPAEGFLATNLIGETVYNGTADDAENIGEVNDLVFDTEGDIESVVIGVGGFLGVGEKDVAMEYDKIKWVEKDGDRWIVVAGSKDELKALPAFDRTPYEMAPATATDGTAPAPDAPSTAKAPTVGDPSTAEATDPNKAATDPTKTAAIDKSSLNEIPAAELRSEELVGTTVYGANDENIGEIGDVVLGSDQKVESIIIDVGGFLGVGEKEVAVGMDNLTFMSNDDGKKYLYTNFTKEQLEAQPAYDEASYAAKRDEQRLIMKQ